MLEEPKKNNDNIIDNASEMFLDRIEEKSKIRVSRMLHEDLKKQNIDDMFRFSMISRNQDVEKIREYRNSDLLDDEKLIDMNNKLTELGEIEQGYKKLFSSTAEAPSIPKEAPKQHYNAPNYGYNINSMNVPASNAIDSLSESLSDSYPSCQGEIDHVTANGKRAEEHKNWSNAIMPLSTQSTNYDNPKMFMTWNEDKMKLANDLDTVNSNNWLYTPQILSKNAMNKYHGKGSSSFLSSNDHNRQFKNNDEAEIELREHLDNILCDENINVSNANCAFINT